ncbi:MAG: 50S ribosomal protein L6 [Planctomycetota bacterium]|nr:MAG: 50S ribosomal protein L6 [Planctomycetota bacterium]
MSRIGRQPIAIPKGVTVKVDNKKKHIQVEGPKGKLELSYHPDMDVKLENDVLTVARPTDSKRHRALHGLTRQLINNMVVGVSQGFEKKLLMVGVQYNAKVQKDVLQMNIGFCHPVNMPIPKGLEVVVDKTVNVDVKGTKHKSTPIYIRGADKQLVGQFAANVRAVRPPEPYKGKGIRYADEHVIYKEGKSVGA